MTIVTHKHMRDLRYCNRGAREFFKVHNLDWPSFVLKGLDSSILLATNDILAKKVVEHAERCNHG